MCKFSHSGNFIFDIIPLYLNLLVTKYKCALVNLIPNSLFISLVYVIPFYILNSQYIGSKLVSATLR